MPTLNVDLDYPSHPKTRRLVGLLGPIAEIFPIRLWCYAGKYFPEDGLFLGYGTDEIEAAVNWTGTKGELVQALLKVGFLLETPAGYLLHEWQEYEGHLARYRARGKMMADARWKRNANATSNATSMLQAIPKQSRAEHTSKTLPQQKPALRVSVLFEQIWQTYPRKLGRKEAERHFKASVKSPQDFLDIQNALENYVRKIRKDGTDEQFIQHGSTWFNNWRDWVRYGGVVMPRAPAPAPKPKVIETPYEEPSEKELRDMHDAKVTAMGVCKAKKCPYCTTESGLAKGSAMAEPMASAAHEKKVTDGKHGISCSCEVCWENVRRGLKSLV